MNIAIPCNAPGGLEAEVSNHFGECDIFTVINLDIKNPQFDESNVKLIENPGHLNCGMVILRLQKVGTDVIILNQLGHNALHILQKENIPLFVGSGTVQQVLKQFVKNELHKVTAANLCEGKS